MAVCKFVNCKERETCLRKYNPWVDILICTTYRNYIEQDQCNFKGLEIPFSYTGVNVEEIYTEGVVYKDSVEDRDSLIFQLYFLDKKKVKEISIHVGVPEVTIYKFISKVKSQYIKKFKKEEKNDGTKVMRRIKLNI